MLPVLTSEQILKQLQQKTHSHQASYFAMYSSWWGGVVTDPTLMVLPIDDHMVHRGDGVFEALKSVDGYVYLYKEHLDRLENSAKAIGLVLPMSRKQLEETLFETLKISKQQNAIIRLFLSRGPGTFGTNPADSVGAQIYIVITSLKTPSAEKYYSGVRIGRSQIPPKESWLAQIKTCNYLPNVLMKKESVERGLDFTVAYDSQGFLTESSTENIFIVNQNDELIHPHYNFILKGTTLLRAMMLAQKIGLKVRGPQDIREEDVLNAKEVAMIGTTLDVLPVTEYEGKIIGSGQVGAIAKALQKELLQDQKNPEVAKKI